MSAVHMQLVCMHGVSAHHQYLPSFPSLGPLQTVTTFGCRLCCSARRQHTASTAVFSPHKSDMRHTTRSIDCSSCLIVCACPCSVLCRDEAQKLWAERAALEALGLKVVCVVHEWIDREVSCSWAVPSSTLTAQSIPAVGQHALSVCQFWLVLFHPAQTVPSRCIPPSSAERLS